MALEGPMDAHVTEATLPIRPVTEGSAIETAGNWVPEGEKSTASWNLGDFENLPECCRNSLETATENLAFIAGDLMSKAEAALDAARAAADAGGEDGYAKSAHLLGVAMGYKSLAEAVA